MREIMSSSGTPVGLGYGDFRDRDGRVNSIRNIRREGAYRLTYIKYSDI